MFVMSAVTATVTPRMMNRVASVTMNEGSPVRTTMIPLTAPRPVVAAMAMRIISQTGRP